MLCEVTVNQIHNFFFFQKILDVSEMSPNVNSLDIEKTNAENLTQNLCYSPHFPLRSDTLS